MSIKTQFSGTQRRIRKVQYVPVRSSKGKGKACAGALFQDAGFSLAAASGPPNLQGS